MQKYPSLIFLILASLCIGFRHAGYLFLLDDNLFLQNYNRVYEKFTQLNAGIFFLFYKWLVAIIPGWIAQRMIYITTLRSAGFLGYHICKKIDPISHYGKRFAGLLCMINPWVYGRMMDGQRYVVASIMAIGRMIYHLYQQSWKHILFASIFAGIAVMLSAHAVFFVLAVCVLYSACSFFLGNNDPIGKVIASMIVIVSSMVIMNIHWIYPMLAPGASSDISVVNVINNDHFQAFATNAGNTNVYLATLGGFGYRGERQHRFMTIQSTHEQARVFIFAMIFICVCCGGYRLYQQKSWRILVFFVSLGLISYVLGIGISGDTIFAPMTQWLYKYMPLYVGLREPQKWIGILMIVYALLGGLGIEMIIKKRFSSDDRTDTLMKGFLLALPFCYTPFQLFAGRGQFSPHDYPSDRYTLKQEKDIPSSCANKPACYDILVFPRHMYQSFSFTHSPIAHPMANFFEKQRTLVGDNMEMPTIYTQSTRPESAMIEHYVGPQGTWTMTGTELDQNFIQDCKKLGIHAILLLKEVDWAKYKVALERISEKKYITLVKETDNYLYYILP